MRFLSVLIATLFISLSVAQAEPISYLRVAVNKTADIIPLVQAGFELLDVRVNNYSKDDPEQILVKWFPENEYITVKDIPGVPEKLKAMGYQIIKAGTTLHEPLRENPEMTLPDQFGWPKTMAGWPGVYGQTTTIADMNNDGRPEIILNNIEGYVYGWRYNGTFVPGYPRNPYQRFLGIDPNTGDSVFVSWITTGSREGGALGDIDGDGQKEFIFGKDIGYLFAMPYGPGYINGFPWDLGVGVFTNEPALFDLDNDGKDEIVIMTYYYPSGSTTYGPAQIHIYNDDGSEMPGWPQTIPVNSESSPVIGDIDGDFEMEIVVGSGRDPNLRIPGEIYAWNLDGNICTGFPIEVGNDVSSIPTLADINLNGIVDILIRIKMTTTNINGVYAFDGQGQLLAGFPAAIPRGGTNGAPAVADLDGDMIPEIAIGVAQAVDSGLVYVFNYDGSLKSGFPRLVNATWVEESVVLADVSGDGLPDVVATTNGLSNDPGKVWAFDYQGNTVSGFPIVTENVVGSSLECTPSVVDIDGDGDTEIFTANWNGTVYAWDSPGLVILGNSWPMFKFDAARTGNHFFQTPNGLFASGSNQPDNWHLMGNYPNPFNAQTKIRFRLNQTSKVTVRVFNVRGQEVGLLADSTPYETGEHSIAFNATDLPSGVYFYRIETEKWSETAKMILMK